MVNVAPPESSMADVGCITTALSHVMCCTVRTLTQWPNPSSPRNFFRCLSCSEGNPLRTPLSSPANSDPGTPSPCTGNPICVLLLCLSELYRGAARSE
jgi:hypothetical protein